MLRGIASLLAFAALIGALALAAEVSAEGHTGRVEFTKRADHICQAPRNEAKARIAHGVRFLERKHAAVRRAGRHFITAYRLMRAAYHQVAQLPRPFEFHVEIAKWLHREHQATGVGVHSAIALKRRHFAKSSRLAHRAAVLEQQAARPVRNFDFHHCRPF
ncbi:MAG: hypothetical protein QOI10_2940 [Solirubrobacterales bacterium]|jgi:hypothetical protein|nr:hypothetical protein [Solirubrobacterales bacterium]